VILIGEIRDSETANIGFDAAQTGHLVLSTLHTNDSISSIDRLTDLEVDRSQIASSLSSIIAQRLVRRICPHCIVDHLPEKAEWSQLFEEVPNHIKFYKGKGCDVCNYTGYMGRSLISELYTIDDALAVSRGAEREELKEIALSHGMKTMVDDGLMKLRDTTLEEIIRNVPHDLLKSFKKYNGKQGSAPRNSASQDHSVFKDGFALSDPVADKNIINAMHTRYLELCDQLPVKTSTVNRDLFGDFIADSFKDICQQHRCDLVIFTIKEKSGKVDISALPAAE